MTIVSKSRHRTQNLCKMRYKEEYFFADGEGIFVE